LLATGTAAAIAGVTVMVLSLARTAETPKSSLIVVPGPNGALATWTVLF
jgi:hypothetical protein